MKTVDATLGRFVGVRVGVLRFVGVKVGVDGRFVGVRVGVEAVCGR